MPERPTGTVTFLFTDIEGSTRQWEAFPDLMRPALQRHDTIMRQCIEERGGYVFKTVGDAFCAAFPTACDALAATLAAQMTLASEAWAAEATVRVRMGLHTGSAEERDGDYFGPVINRVARLMSVGYGGQVLLSAATQELVRDQLPTDADLRDLGLALLKDLGRPERIFQLLHPSLPVDFAPLKSLDNPALPNNLPQQATSFVGREKEVAQIKDGLGKTRLLTLLGTGGAGKTRLSLQVAADLLDGDGDGVWFVEFAPITDPVLVPQAVARVLNVREEPGKPLLQTLLAALKSKCLLLILDNCEHLVAACAALAADLLRVCPGVHLLVSSRERLGVPGEQIYRVPSLSLPNPAQVPTVAVLSQFEAVQLFVERAQAVQTSFAVTDANAPAVAQICWRLDGIPLALELAAARVRSLPIEEVNARLDNRFRLLTGGSRTLLPRQQTLRALVDWSYDLLRDQEKTLLARLSVFAGGWTLDAAEVLCCCDTVEDWEVLDLLTELVDKSLVVYEEGAGGACRYRLLETVRQYGAERLAESGGTASVRSCHRGCFLSLTEQAEPFLQGPEAAAWLARLEREHENLRAALSWCETEADSAETEGAEKWLRLCGSLGRFWSVRGHFSEGRQWLTKVLQRTADQANSPARAKALNGAGTLAWSQGDLAAAQALYQECMEIQNRMGDQRGVAASLGNLGLVVHEQSDYEAARALCEQSLTLYRQLGDQRGIAHSLNNLGAVAYEQCDFAAARTILEESLVLLRLTGDPQGIANSLTNLGAVVWNLGDYESARAFHNESLELRRQSGDQRGIADSLVNLAYMAAQQGDSAAARTLVEESLDLYRQMGDQLGIGDSLYALGNTAFEQGDSGAARALFAESLNIRLHTGDQQGIAGSLEGLAGVAVSEGLAKQGARLWGAADALREEIGAPLTPQERARQERQVNQARQSLGEDAFAAAFAAGRALTWEQAVAEALEEARDA